MRALTVGTLIVLSAACLLLALDTDEKDSSGKAAPLANGAQPQHALTSDERAEVPAAVLARIKAKAAEDYPDNYSTRLYVVNNELKSYLQLESLQAPDGVPDRVFRGIVRAATEDYPHNYSTRLFVVKNQLRAWHELQSFVRPDDIPAEVLGAVMHKAAGEYSDNYSTQLFVVKNQLKAYRKLRSDERN